MTRRRRLLAFVCDALGAQLVGVTAGVATQVVLEYIVRDHAAVLDGTISTLVGILVPVALWLVVVLVTGQSIGDLAVELRYRGGPLVEPLARLLRAVGGVAGFTALGLLPAPLSLLQALFAVVAIILLFTTELGRGLPGILSGRRLEDARAPREGGSAGPSQPAQPAK